MIKRAPHDLPPEVARAFVKDMQAFFAEGRCVGLGCLKNFSASVLLTIPPFPASLHKQQAPARKRPYVVLLDRDYAHRSARER